LEGEYGADDDAQLGELANSQRVAAETDELGASRPGNGVEANERGILIWCV
jgi:hypothetical protein